MSITQPYFIFILYIKNAWAATVQQPDKKLFPLFLYAPVNLPIVYMYMYLSYWNAPLFVFCLYYFV